MPVEQRSWIEIMSDGRKMTKVYLVIMAEDGQELRYAIPHVRSIAWNHHDPSTPPVATLELGNVHMKTRAHIRSHTTTVENLLAEIAASRIASSGEDEDKFVNGGVAFAEAWNAKVREQSAAPKAPGEEDDRERLVRSFRDHGSRKEE